MTFNNITNDTNCNCFDVAAENVTSLFARVLKKSKVTDKDFFSHWERNHRAVECEKICGLKGVSVSKIDDNEIKGKIVSYYSEVFKVSPNYKRGVLIFKLKNDAGIFKSTPSKNNPYHHDLYKSDGFTLKLVDEIETCDLKP